MMKIVATGALLLLVAAVAGVAVADPFMAYGTSAIYGNIVGFYANGTAWPVMTALDNPQMLAGDRTTLFYVMNTSVYSVNLDSLSTRLIYTAPETISDLSSWEHSLVFVIHGVTLDVVDVTGYYPTIKRSLAVPMYARGEPLNYGNQFVMTYQKENWMSVIDVQTAKMSNYPLSNCYKPMQVVVARTDGLVAVMCFTSSGYTVVQEGNMLSMPDTAYSWSSISTTSCNSLNAGPSTAVYINCGSQGVMTATRSNSWRTFSNQKNFADFHLLDH